MRKYHGRIVTCPCLHKNAEVEVHEAIITIIIEVNLITTQGKKVSDLLAKETIVKRVKICRHQTK